MHFRLLQGLATVEMKRHVTQLLFKQDLRLLLCWEHNQPLCSAGHYCSAGSLCSRPKYVQRASCTWIRFLSLHQPEAAMPELGCSACTAAAAVQSLMHRSPCPNSLGWHHSLHHHRELPVPTASWMCIPTDRQTGWMLATRPYGLWS